MYLYPLSVSHTLLKLLLIKIAENHKGQDFHAAKNDVILESFIFFYMQIYNSMQYKQIKQIFYYVRYAHKNLLHIVNIFHNRHIILFIQSDTKIIVNNLFMARYLYSNYKIQLYAIYCHPTHAIRSFFICITTKNLLNQHKSKDIINLLNVVFNIIFSLKPGPYFVVKTHKCINKDVIYFIFYQVYRFDKYKNKIYTQFVVGIYICV